MKSAPVDEFWVLKVCAARAVRAGRNPTLSARRSAVLSRLARWFWCEEFGGFLAAQACQQQTGMAGGVGLNLRGKALHAAPCRFQVTGFTQ